MSYTQKLSRRAVKDLDALDKDVCARILNRLDELVNDPYDSRLSTKLTNKGELRKSRVGDWRIIFTVDDEKRELLLVTIEHRGQVYRRI